MFVVVLALVLIVSLLTSVYNKVSACGPMHKSDIVPAQNQWDPELERCDGVDCDCALIDCEPIARFTEALDFYELLATPEAPEPSLANEFSCPAHHQFDLEWVRLPYDGWNFLDFEIVCLPAGQAENALLSGDLLTYFKPGLSSQPNEAPSSDDKAFGVDQLQVPLTLHNLLPIIVSALAPVLLIGHRWCRR